MIAWIDLETTGLDPESDQIVEAACVVTDDDLKEIARFERVLHHPQAAGLADVAPEDRGAAGAHTGIDPYVIEMHQVNGLWRASANSSKGVRETAHALATFIAKHAKNNGERPQLGGASVHFDRAFLREHMPEVERELHHRHLDTSSWNELARRTWPTVHQGRTRAGAAPAHRALADALESIEVARYYRSALTPKPAADPALITQQIARWLYEGPGCSVDEIISGILRGDWRQPLPEGMSS